MSVPMEYNSMYRDSQAMDNLEKQLICPVCLEMFTKPVVILPCQHNLCRKCANDIFQTRGTALGSGGCFRCPSCHQEIILDRHGVYGLQRNLLVENIIDIYKQESLRSTAKPEQPTCDEHDEEKINIYCISCETPTCSLCKVFGAHKACEVAPLLNIYKQQKCELGDGIGALVATNDAIQTYITHLEETSKNIEDNCRSLKQTIYEKFDSLFAVLETKKQEMMRIITNEQDGKISHCKYLIQTYGQHIQSMSKLMESVLQSVEEPQMAVFLWNAKMLTAKVSEANTASVIEELDHDYENMDHYNIDLEKELNLLQAINFLEVKEKSEVEEAAAGEKEDNEVEARLSELSATKISEVFSGASAREESLSSSSEPCPEQPEIMGEIHEKENLSAEHCGVGDEEQGSGSSGAVVSASRDEPREVPSDDKVFVKDELSLASRGSGDQQFLDDPNVEYCSAVDDIAEKGKLSAECSGAGIGVEYYKIPIVVSPNVTEILGADAPNSISFALDKISAKDIFRAECNGARTEAPEDQTSVKSSVAETDYLEKNEPKIESSCSVVNVFESCPNAQLSIAADEVCVQEEPCAQSECAWNETIEDHPGAESLVAVVHTAEKECSLEPSGCLVNVREDDPRAEPTPIVEGLVKEGSDIAGFEAPERNEGNVESSGLMVNLPQDDLIIELSSSLNEVDSPEEKVSNVDSSGSAVNVPELISNVEPSNKGDDIPEEENLGSETSGGQICLPELEPSTESSNIVNEVPAKGSPHVVSVSTINDVPGKEGVNTDSEVPAVEILLMEESSAASPPVSDGVFETREVVAVSPDIVDVFPGIKGSIETLCNVTNATVKIEESNASAPETTAATSKECISRSPDQVSEIEILMDKSSSAIRPETMIQELIAAPSGTADVNASVVEPITAPCRASLESVVASPGPTSGIFPGSESTIPFTDVETGRSTQEKCDVTLSETTAQQGKSLSGNYDTGDLKMPQELAEVEDNTKLYPGWHKCGSWHVLKSTKLVSSPSPSAASHDLSVPSSATENQTQPEVSCVATVIKTPECENTGSPPAAKALGFCISLMAMMIILLNLWNRIEFMACTWKG
ncbi:uncharacterized protein [Hemitrygon akajei]|uniref:uncharacterized protein isoform X2 n=1 Tax=Hemitrygon akajei TaxID=2704970 RepID=UPI003BFA019E